MKIMEKKTYVFARDSFVHYEVRKDGRVCGMCQWEKNERRSLIISTTQRSYAPKFALTGRGNLSPFFYCDLSSRRLVVALCPYILSVCLFGFAANGTTSPHHHLALFSSLKSLVLA
jgi:hypothetical protein